jgi:hypothetical protein
MPMSWRSRRRRPAPQERLHARAIGLIVRTVAEFDGEDLNEALRVADACAGALRGSSPASGGGHVERPQASEQNG